MSGDASMECVGLACNPRIDARAARWKLSMGCRGVMKGLSCAKRLSAKGANALGMGQSRVGSGMERSLARSMLKSLPFL